MSNRDCYFDEWDENSPIGWWNDGRKKTNVIIRLVNEWTLGGSPDGERVRLLRRIEMGLQTFADEHTGGSGWRRDLLEMRDYVRERAGLSSTGT